MSEHASPKSVKARKRLDLVRRGIKKSSPAGIILYAALRGLDPFLQYQILARGWGSTRLSSIGISIIPYDAPIHTGIGLIDSLQLSLPRLILLAMALSSAAKQIFWITHLANEEFPPSSAILIAANHTILNSLNSLLFICSPTSTALSFSTFAGIPAPIITGTALYTLGLTLELVGEYQRKGFKSKPENEGKVCKTGLWGLARHINYGGHLIWRGGYAMVGGSWLAGLTIGGAQALQLATQAVPGLDEYANRRYGKQWTRFKQEVPWVLIPWVY